MRAERFAPKSVSARSSAKRLQYLVALAAACVVIPLAPSFAGDVEVLQAMVPPTDRPGGDVPMVMRLINHGADDDALLRIRCPFANFSEKRTVDYGEGAPSSRAITAIKLPAGGEVVLTTKGFHVMLLQVTEKLAEGQVLPCTLAFRKAGTEDIQVHVSQAAAHS